MATQEITVRIAKTIQEQQYEPLTMEVTIREECTKKKYYERLDELTELASEKVFGYLNGESDEEAPEDGEPQSEEGFEEDQNVVGGEDGPFPSEDQSEEDFEEGPNEEFEEGGSGDEFEDFFEDDPGGEED